MRRKLLKAHNRCSRCGEYLTGPAGCQCRCRFPAHWTDLLHKKAEVLQTRGDILILTPNWNLAWCAMQFVETVLGRRGRNIVKHGDRSEWHYHGGDQRILFRTRDIPGVVETFRAYGQGPIILFLEDSCDELLNVKRDGVTRETDSSK